MIEELDRYRGSLLGLAAGDALGTTLEFQEPWKFAAIDDIVGGGPFDLAPGEWTDDTSMALCLAESLVESPGFDPLDQMQRYCRWKNEGYLSSNGRCFDIGMTVAEALRRFEYTGDPISGSTDPFSAGNGSLMRLAPVPLFFACDPRRAVELAGESSRTTHGAVEAVDACRYIAALIVGTLQGRAKEELLSVGFEPAPGLWKENPLAPRIREVAEGEFKRDLPPPLTGTGGYVVPSLAVALWAFHRTDNFRDGALRAVNVGYDADTYGAIYGQLAGAYYGVDGIPEAWREKVAKRELILSFADRLHALRA